MSEIFCRQEQGEDRQGDGPKGDGVTVLAQLIENGRQNGAKTNQPANQEQSPYHGVMLSGGPADRQAVDAQSRLADTHGHALAILAAGTDAWV